MTDDIIEDEALTAPFDSSLELVCMKCRSLMTRIERHLPNCPHCGGQHFVLIPANKKGESHE